MTQVAYLNKKREDIKRLGTRTGFAPSLWLDKVNNKEIQVLSDTAVLSVIKMATHGLVDVINLDYSVVNYHLNNLNQNKKLLMSKKLPHQKISFYLSTIKHKEVILKFNQYLIDNQKFVTDLKRKYQIIEGPFDLSSF